MRLMSATGCARAPLAGAVNQRAAPQSWMSRVPSGPSAASEQMARIGWSTVAASCVTVPVSASVKSS